ncbi:MAG: NFACT family protein, partial [Cyanobacteriota bacterium]
MINFDSLTLSALIEELYPVLVGSRVHRIQQPTKYIVLLTLRSQGKNRKLCISAHPKYSYIALLDYSDRKFVNPQTPPMFCMLLRKHMEGAKITDLKQPSNERILEIFFESFNELGDKVQMTLACEIMGKYSNVILYITKSKLILGCAHNVGELMSSKRELAGSLPYVLPPVQNKLSILNISNDQFKTMATALQLPIDIWMSQHFHNISLALARELCVAADINVAGKATTLTAMQNIDNLYKLTYNLLARRDFKPSISSDNELYSLLAADQNKKWI